jgi:two-component system response regulator DesR
LGLERVLSHDPAVSVRAHRRLRNVRGPADVVVVCERGQRDAAATCAAANEQLDAGVVFVAAGADSHVVLDCLAAGATGFVTEGDATAQLQAATRAAAKGEYHVGPWMLTLLLDSQRSERRRARSSHGGEQQLLALLAGGRTTDEIAAALGVAPKTVRNRASLLYRRLGVRSRAQAVQVAEVRGLLDPAPPPG